MSYVGRYAFLLLAAFGLVDFIVQVVTNGSVRVIHRMLSAVFR